LASVGTSEACRLAFCSVLRLIGKNGSVGARRKILAALDRLIGGAINAAIYMQAGENGWP
jgi:hypothetical protein